MVHPLFDELRTEGTRMPNGRDFPRLFDFTKEGAAASLLFPPPDTDTDKSPRIYTELSISPDLNRQLVPDWCIPELESRGIDLNNFVPIPLEELRITLD